MSELPNNKCQVIGCPNKAEYEMQTDLGLTRVLVKVCETCAGYSFKKPEYAFKKLEVKQ